MSKKRVIRVMGPLVEAENISGAAIHEVVYVGDQKLLGEIIRLNDDKASIQVYEETTGLKPGEPVETSGKPLVVELGPGLLKSIYDGVQRPLVALKEQEGDFIGKGVSVNKLDRERKWKFTAKAGEGDEVKAGDVLGTTPEGEVITHRILVPPGVSGKVKKISSGEYTVTETVCILEDKTELSMMHEWPVKKARPIRKKEDPSEPLQTGQRIIDLFFPIAKGGTAAIPGPFGSGKTVVQHQLAKWSDANVIIYVGCGERGNEMTEVLDEFPELIDPHTQKPLMERTVLIANTSNMPVAAREASVYTGVTIAEYYRDMGYNTALMADSTSRWAEALREISSRLEEMPGEEGYPAYLGSRLASFYERAGRITTIGGEDASLSIIGAVSPPGGDFSEPVTQNTLRIVRVFWALDARLADRRHFPAIDWLKSYNLYERQLDPWYIEKQGKDFVENRVEAMNLLQRENELMEIVQLVGSDALPESERLLLESARSIREDFLQQNAFDEVDSYCSLEKQYWMLKIILELHTQSRKAIDSGKKLSILQENPVHEHIARMKYMSEEEFKEKRMDLHKEAREAFK